MNTVTETYQGRNSNIVEKLVRSKWFWIVLCGFFFIYPLAKSVQRKLPDALPIYSALSDYSFTDENGRPYGSKELRGKVYIANFIFTSCQTSCPVLFSKIQLVQHRIRGVIDRAAIVSFTVDPEVDTSQVLYNKARELKSNPNVWRFLTGNKAEISKLLVDGFKVPIGEKELAGTIMEVAHSNKLVLVDQKGRIRGYYGTDTDDLNKLMIDTGLLINLKDKT